MLAEMRGVTVAFAIGLLSGCAAGRARGGATPTTTPSPPIVHGSRADMTTRAGVFDGYVVEDRCRERDCFGVRGSGATWFEGDKPLVGFDDATTRERWRGMITDAIARPSVGSSGFGGYCREGGLFVELDDWRDLDGAIAHVGALLGRGGWRDEVALCVHPNSIAVELDAQRGR